MCTYAYTWFGYLGISEQLSLKSPTGEFHTGQDMSFPPQAALFLCILHYRLSPGFHPEPKQKDPFCSCLSVHTSRGNPEMLSLLPSQMGVLSLSLDMSSAQTSPLGGDVLPDPYHLVFASNLHRLLSLPIKHLLWQLGSSCNFYSFALGTGCFQQSLKVQDLRSEGKKKN